MKTEQNSKKLTPPFQAHGKKLGVFVLTYNAEKFIEDTLQRIPECIWNAVEMVYIIDDCSFDETTKTVLSYPEKHPKYRDKIRIFRNRINRRYGGNQKYGYQYAIDQGLDAVVMLHGDGQYAPEMLPEMFRPLVEQDADMVNGSRMICGKNALAGGMPRYKFIANIFLTKVENLLSGLHMSEFHSGFRGYSTRFLKRIPLWECSDEWHFDSHILFQAKQAKAKIVEISIPTHYGEEVCNVNGIAYGLNCIRSAFMFALHRMGLLLIPRYDLRPAHLIENRRLDERFSDHSRIVGALLRKGVQGRKVLDIGFGCAAIAAKLKEASAILDGIDCNPAAVEENGKIYRKAYLADANDLDDIGLSEKYDIIILSDILQYLVHPEEFLSRLKKYLVKGGLLVVNVPNIANIHVRLSLLRGNFTLHHRGILDEKALHFYTINSLRQTLKKTCWRVEKRDVTEVPIVQTVPLLHWGIFKSLTHIGRLFTLMLPGLFAYHIIYYCTNPNESDLL